MEETKTTIEINGKEFQVEQEVKEAFIDLLNEIELKQVFESKIIMSKVKYGNDADLGRVVRKLIN
jgi:hypothetical protein